MLSENQLAILQDRYFRRDEQGNYIESTWEQVARRVCRAIASAESLYTDDVEQIKAIEQKFYEMVSEMIFLPSSPMFFNAGPRKGIEPELLYKPIEQMTLEDYRRLARTQKESIGTLSACFLIPIADSMESIMDCVKEMSMTTKWGGGVGINFSSLRPSNSPVNGTGGVASGPIPFMHVINSAAEAIRQGSLRRAALMGILDVTHPDVESFITCKRNNDGKSVLSYFNISVNIDDPEGMLKLLEEDGEIELKFNGRTYRTVKARELMYKIAENAHLRGDPGLIFVGRARKYWPNPENDLVGSNPCGEVIMPPYFNCTLASLNLYKITSELGLEAFYPDTEASSKFAELVYYAVRFLDNVVTLNNFPLKQQKEVNEKYRMIGLGMMGLADVLFMHKIRYGSPESLELMSAITASMQYYSKRASMKLSVERGPYEMFKISRYNDESFLPFALIESNSRLIQAWNSKLKELPKEWKKTGLRNVRTMAIAPTGTISSLAEVSSGIEPAYSLVYTRNMTTKSGEIKKLTIIDPEFARQADEQTLQDVLKGAKLRERPGFEHFVTALEISPVEHILAQHHIQSYVDGSCSKTINMPSSATVEDVLEAYKLAMKLNCYGITVYRDQSLQTQVLETTAKPVDVMGIKLFVDTAKGNIVPKPRRKFMPSYTGKFVNEVGTTYVTISLDDDGKPCEIFIEDGRSKSEIIGRLSSVALRSGVAIDEIIEQLKKCRSHYARELGSFLEEFVREIYKHKPVGEECPVCGEKTLIKSEGCAKCLNCGYSRCG